MRERLVVIVKQLDDIPVPLRHGQVRVEPLERRHLPELHALNWERGDPSADARFATDVAAGYGGFVGYRGDELVCSYWWVDRDMRPRHRDMTTYGLELDLHEGDVYGCDFYVRAAHRGGGTVPDFLYQVESGLRERGYERLWGYVVESNQAASWTYAARGYEPRWAIVRERTLYRWRNRVAPLDADRTESR